LELPQDILSSDPVDKWDEKNWDTVGGAIERSLSPDPTVEEVMPKSAQQVSGAGEPRASTEERGTELSATTGALELVVAHVEEEVPAEAGLVDIASILGAPTVTIVWSSL
jgi:hypothetical protein